MFRAHVSFSLYYAFIQLVFTDLSPVVSGPMGDARVCA